MQNLAFPATGPVVLDDPLDVERLISYLRQPARRRPVAVLTVGPQQSTPYIDPATVWQTGAGRVDVVTIPTSELTLTFTERLEDPRAGVYHGACRVYPPGSSWESDPFSVPLRMARSPREIEALPDHLLLDVKRERDRALSPASTTPRSASTAAGAPSTALDTAATTPDGEVAPPDGDTTTPDTGATPTDAAAGSLPDTPKPDHPVPRPLQAGTPPQADPDPRVPVPVRHEIATDEEAMALGAHLRSPARRLPTVVVSRATGASAAFADVGQLRDDLEGLADVAEITTVEASWAFSRAVPDRCQVYGGAGRVYPLGTDWELNPYLSPLRFAYREADGGQLTGTLIGDAMRMASATPATPSPTAGRVAVTGEVTGIVAQRAVVTYHGQEHGVLWPELVEPGLPAERLFAKGMRVEGELDPVSRRIDVRGMRRPADDALAGYRPGQTVLVRVAEVEAGSCRVELFPGFLCSIPADYAAEDLTDLRELVTAGDVLPAWFGGRDEATGEWLLSLREAEDAVDAVSAPSILDGGPPWLVPTARRSIAATVDDATAPDATALPTEAAPVDSTPPTAMPSDMPSAATDTAPTAASPATATPVVTPLGLTSRDPTGTELSEDPTQFLEALRRDKDQLVAQLTRKKERIATLESELAAVRSQLRREIRHAAKRSGPAPDDSGLFERDEDQLDFEIRQAWARMIPASEKKDLPLTSWTYGPDFFATLRAVEGVSRDKVVEVIVHVLTGRDATLASRQLHRLRTGTGGDDAPVVRGQGETCWRVSLQNNTAGARRLHYWRCADGSIELSSIRVHDDFRP